MPARRSLGAVAGPSVPATLPVVELHPITKRLRKMWKFAAVCQFLFVFDEAFGMSGFETESLETDFENNETNVVPDLIKRLLYTLTLDRTIDLDNWQHHLRTQYNLREEDSVGRFGTAEAPIEWAQLSLEDKIATLHDLCEWQLMDPERFRKLVKSEEDITTWRVSPIGWDAHDNAYWLFDDNRIWIQRPEPAPKAPAKAKAPAKKGTKRARMEAAAARRAASSAAKSSPAPKSSGTKRGRPSDVTPSSTPSKRTRSSLADSTPSTPSRPPPRRGTRTSARFAPQEDESTANAPSNGCASRSAAASASYSSDSELSEPPEDMDEEEDTKPEPATNEVKGDEDAEMETAEAEDSKDAEEEEEKNEDKKEATDQAEEWVEFETIVVTRQEWLDFAKRFAKSKDPNEKNLHRFINNEILDQVLAAMDEIERQRQLEQALANRKRSSRIAMKESEREERKRDREARARMEEKMAAIRKEEELKRQKEEEEQEAQKSREQRLREREERLRARELEIETKAIREEEERERREKEREERKRRREEIIANGGIPPSSQESTPVPGDGSVFVDANGQPVEEEEEEWELNCEVCGKAAISPPDEDDEIVCCEQCSVWQHIKCWDAFDKQVLGLKKKRDWEAVDFFCSKCRPPPAGVPVPHPGILSKRDKASPRSNKRASNGPESPTRKVDGAAAGGNAESPRQRIKLVSGSKSSEAAKGMEAVQPTQATDAAGAGLVKPPTIPSQTLRPPTIGAQPAETGVLTSSGAATRPSPAPAPVGQLPPPSSHAVPTTAAGSEKPTVGRPLLPSAPVGNRSSAVGDPSKTDAANASVSKPTNGGPSSGAPSSAPSNAIGLGMGRPTQAPQFPAVGSPLSPSSGPVASPSASTVANGASTLSPRSPSYGANLGSPGYRRPSQPSGSFPMRHTPAKSPLSRPYESPLRNGDPPANGFSLGPPRAASPSASRGAGQYASLGATAKSLHPSSAAAPAAPLAPTVVGNVAGGAFATAFGEAPPATAASDAAPASGASVVHGSPTRPQLSSTDSDGANVQAKEPRPLDLDAGVSSTSSQGEVRDQRRGSSAAAQAFRTLEHGLGSPQPGEKEGSSAPEVKVVELPPTHI